MLCPWMWIPKLPSFSSICYKGVGPYLSKTSLFARVLWELSPTPACKCCSGETKSLEVIYPEDAWDERYICLHENHNSTKKCRSSYASQSHGSVMGYEFFNFWDHDGNRSVRGPTRIMMIHLEGCNKNSQGVFHGYIETSHEMSQYHGLQNFFFFLFTFKALQKFYCFLFTRTPTDHFRMGHSWRLFTLSMPPSESIGSSTPNLKDWKFQRLTAFLDCQTINGICKHSNIVCI